jgi:hypothetical protein
MTGQSRFAIGASCRFPLGFRIPLDTLFAASLVISPIWRVHVACLMCRIPASPCQAWAKRSSKKPTLHRQ